MRLSLLKIIGFLAATISLVSADVYTCPQMQALTSSLFSGPTQTTMLCIAFKESSYNTAALNPTSKASGLFQILPEHCGELCPECKTPSDLFNPTINAQCAKNILNKQGFKAWTTYSSGDCNGWSQCVAPSKTSASSTHSSSTTSSTHGSTSGPTSAGSHSSGPSSAGGHSSGPSSAGGHSSGPSSAGSDAGTEGTSSNPTSSNPTSSNPTTSDDTTTYTGSSGSSGMNFDYKKYYNGGGKKIEIY